MKINYTWFIFHLQRMVKNYSLREFVSTAQARVIGQEKIEGVSALNITDEESHLNELKTTGLTEFEHPLGDAIVEDIIGYTNTLKLYDPYNDKTAGFDYKSMPPNINVASFKGSDVMINKHLLAIANDPAILRIVGGFLGATPTISNVLIMWSVAGKDSAKKAQIFHRDVDDFKFCKLFIYLTDVGENDGPHIYVKNSANENKLTKIRRYTDNEIAETFGNDNIVKLSRPKGSFFIANTYGFHKGELPIDNSRLMAIIAYSLNPIGWKKYTPVSTPNNYSKYVNRLYVS